MQMSFRKTAAVINMMPMIDILLVLLITFMLLPTSRQ
jgi:biopolymer transport protein ExbD